MMDGYIRKNHLTINEEQEIYEIQFDDGSVWHGSSQDVTALLGTEGWETGDEVVDFGTAVRLSPPDRII